MTELIKESKPQNKKVDEADNILWREIRRTTHYANAAGNPDWDPEMQGKFADEAIKNLNRFKEPPIELAKKVRALKK